MYEVTRTNGDNFTAASQTPLRATRREQCAHHRSYRSLVRATYKRTRTYISGTSQHVRLFVRDYECRIVHLEYRRAFSHHLQMTMRDARKKLI